MSKALESYLLGVLHSGVYPDASDAVRAKVASDTEAFYQQLTPDEIAWLASRGLSRALS